jgi:hypothetical protein
VYVNIQNRVSQPWPSNMFLAARVHFFIICHESVNATLSGVAMSVAVWTAGPVLVCGSITIISLISFLEGGPKTVTYKSTIESSIIALRNSVR